MEYIYSAMLLHSAGKEITNENIKKVLTSVGVKVDEARIKALTASLEGVNIDEAIKSAAIPVVAQTAPSSKASTDEGKAEEKKVEKKKKEEPEVTEEEAAAGLGALFG